MVEPPGRAQELVMKLMVSVVAVAIGSLILAAPDRAAGVWASQRVAKSTPEQRAVLIGWYRVLGISLCLAGILLGVKSNGP